MNPVKKAETESRAPTRQEFYNFVTQHQTLITRKIELEDKKAALLAKMNDAKVGDVAQQTLPVQQDSQALIARKKELEDKRAALLAKIGDQKVAGVAQKTLSDQK